MTETDKKQNLRLALEEANRWLRYTDNFFWILSSFLMIGTGLAVSKAFEWNGGNCQVLIMGIIMIAAWILFLMFKRNIFKKSKHWITRVNYFEKELAINILPEELIKGEPEKCAIEFVSIMTIVACTSILLWCWFIFQFIYKNWCNLCHCFQCCYLFH